MKFPKLLMSLLVFGSLIFSVCETHAQKRQTAKPTKKVVTPATSSMPDFDSLLSADSYKVYAEVRGVGQLIRSNSGSELIDPVMKLAAPPKEFNTLVKWLSTHADAVMTSRMLVATWPTAKNVPEVLVAIDFDSTEEASRFAPQLNSFLPKVLPAPRPEASTRDSESRKTDETKNAYYVQQVGSLVLISPTPIVLKNLRPAHSKLLTDDVSFRVGRSRFNSEQIFIYVNVDAIEADQENRRKQYEEEERGRIAELQETMIENSKALEPASEAEKTADEESATPEVVIPPVEPPPTTAPTPDPLSMAMDTLATSFFQGQTKWPDAVGFGVSFENDSFDVRALLISAQGEKPDAIPILPKVILGPAIAPESPSILPADTELFATLSLDLPQIYAAMSKPAVVGDVQNNQMQTIKDTELEGPFARIEKQLKLKIKDDVVPLLGSEIVFSMPVKALEDGRPPQPSPPKSEETEDQKPTSEPSFVLAFSVRDKEGVRALLPRIVDSLGFKGASSFAHTEQTGGTEIVSYGNTFSYAFIENFLVLSADTATIKHVVDSYLNHNTLSSDIQFKNFTRWQPRQLQAQIYVSPALMESYKSWASQPTTLISDQTREILSRLSMVAQPVTYSLSSDGLGALHELHVPKNLILMAVAGISAESNPSPIIANERATIGVLHTIASAEVQYKSGKGAGSFATIEQLVAAGFLTEEMLQNHGYKIDVMLIADKFQVTAVPDEYGKTGKTSYFIDHSNVLRGADRGGSIATAEDNPINY